MPARENPENLSEPVADVGKLRGALAGKWQTMLLLVIVEIGAELLTCARNRKSLLIEQFFDVQHVFDVLAPVHALSSATLHRS